MPTDRPDLDRVDERYEAWTVAEEGPPVRAPALSFGDLVSFLSRGGSLTSDQQRLLFKDRRLRAEFQRLKEEFAASLPDDDAAGPVRDERIGRRLFTMPAMAAAATDREVDERTFAGGTVRIRASRVPNQIYVLVTLEDARRPPRALLLEGSEGETLMLDLPEPHEDDVIRILKDLRRAEDAAVIRLLRAPATSGTFLE